MRIGVDIRCLMDGRRSGVEEYTLGVLGAMIRAAPHDTFLLFANSRRPMRFSEVPGGANVELRAFRYPNALFNLSLKMLERPVLDDLLGGVDVFFVPSFRLAPLSPQCPFIVTVHDLSYHAYPEFFTRQRRFWHWLMEPEKLVRRACQVITDSAAIAVAVRTRYQVPADRLTVIPAGIPEQMQPVPPDDQRAARVRARYRLPDHYLLFLGTLEPRKNLLALLGAYRAAREASISHPLVIAGHEGWMGDAFLRALVEHPYRADIIVTGFIADADKPVLYGLADLFVYPSRYEGFGFPPLEALACGTPVVTSFNSAIPEVAGQWATLVNPYDAEELAFAIAEHLRAPARVPAAVSETIRARYSWERAGRETLRVLREAAVGRGTASACRGRVGPERASSTQGGGSMGGGTVGSHPSHAYRH